MPILHLVPRAEPDAVPVQPEAAADDVILSFAGPVDGLNALIVGAGGPGLLCGLLRRGCAAAMSLRTVQTPERGAYDLVIAPRVTETSDIGQLIYRVKRALAPTGQLVAFVPGAGPGALAGLLVRSIRMGGFVAVKARTEEGGLLVKAELPLRNHASIVRLARRQA